MIVLSTFKDPSSIPFQVACLHLGCKAVILLAVIINSLILNWIESVVVFPSGIKLLNKHINIVCYHRAIEYYMAIK